MASSNENTRSAFPLRPIPARRLRGPRTMRRIDPPLPPAARLPLRAAYLGAILSLAGPGCARHAQTPPEQLPVRSVITEDSPRMISTTEIVPPGSDDAILEPAPPATEPQPLFPDEVDVPSSDRRSTPQARGALVGGAAIQPAIGALISGVATLVEEPEGVHARIELRLATRGAYEVRLSHDATACSSLRPAPAVQPPTFVLGTVSIAADGTGALDVVLPKRRSRGGLKALERRALVVYEDRTPDSSAVLGAEPIACGTITLTDAPAVG